MTSRNFGRAPISRRTMLAGAGGLAFAVAGSARAAEVAEATAPNPTALRAADAAPLVPTEHFKAAFERIVGSGTPIEGTMTIEMPEDAENGNIVPYKINVESPMTEADHVARVHLLSTQNPQALVATFHFTPLSGVATVGGRMRLAKTQEVVAVALTSANTLLIARTTVHVGIGGCGVE
ncbi:thiosulfate oxidation carrier protein SoxY [Parvibaculum sp.]|uniref:thiosulfate oxidation carrier protein SoxY n=1 Tax=Parvibaculum sp. TaxID=2024848 RepID=UPI003BAD8D98